jgi:hypothetical protein
MGKEINPESLDKQISRKLVRGPEFIEICKKFLVFQYSSKFRSKVKNFKLNYLIIQQNCLYLKVRNQ